MRLLIYLLALVSGFSAADAARAEVSPASSVAQTAVAAAEALVAQEQAGANAPSVKQPRETHLALPVHSPLLPAFSTPVTRHDRSRE